MRIYELPILPVVATYLIVLTASEDPQARRIGTLLVESGAKGMKKRGGRTQLLLALVV